MYIHPYYNSTKKRIFDLSLALVLLLFFLPLLLGLLLLVKLIDKNPPLFKQKRLGKNKKVFIMYKIRTMREGASQFQKKLQKINEAPYPMFKIKNDPRFTQMGKILSRLGLDELPQIFNIIIGNMSFIGPRPLPIHEANQLATNWDFRYEVKPGILSKWALSPKRHTSLAEWKNLELNGLKYASIKNDLALILQSIKTVLLRH